MVAVRGRVNHRDNGVNVVAMDLAILDFTDSDLDTNPPVVISLPAEKVTEDLVSELRSSLRRHHGEAPVQIQLRGRGTTHLLQLEETLRVSASGGFISELKALIGADCVTTGR